MHKYAYVHGDPIWGTDPTGESLLGIGVAVLALAIVTATFHRAIIPGIERAKDNSYRNSATGRGGKNITDSMQLLMTKMKAEWSLLHVDKKHDIITVMGSRFDLRQAGPYNWVGVNKAGAESWDVIALASPVAQEPNFSVGAGWAPRSVTVNGGVFYAHDVNYFFYGYLHGLAYKDDHQSVTASAIDLNSLDMIQVGDMVSWYRPAGFLFNAFTPHDGSEENRKNWAYVGWRSAITDTFITPSEERYGLPNAIPSTYPSYRGWLDFRAKGLTSQFVVNSKL